MEWLTDSTPMETVCGICQHSFNSPDDILRLLCYDTFHKSCLFDYALSLPINTAPHGYTCPVSSCGQPIIPPDDVNNALAVELRTHLDGAEWTQRLTALSGVGVTSNNTNTAGSDSTTNTSSSWESPVKDNGPPTDTQQGMTGTPITSTTSTTTTSANTNTNTNSNSNSAASASSSSKTKSSTNSTSNSTTKTTSNVNPMAYGSLASRKGATEDSFMNDSMNDSSYDDHDIDDNKYAGKKTPKKGFLNLLGINDNNNRDVLPSTTKTPLKQIKRRRKLNKRRFIISIFVLLVVVGLMWVYIQSVRSFLSPDSSKTIKDAVDSTESASPNIPGVPSDSSTAAAT
eukprot:TRINITY_DN1113_c0_g1_i1.p1 TRINITY_DN1113_c0_g1~~TRINITY_DN1113_c0_g1_i1.p1  ORF type:complete len:343 (+),score=78.09 TRINITY_DN1113_c0_g1_i1:1691-2719(+)